MVLGNYIIMNVVPVKRNKHYAIDVNIILPPMFLRRGD
jgi:hypothetical protein